MGEDYVPCLCAELTRIPLEMPSGSDTSAATCPWCHGAMALPASEAALLIEQFQRHIANLIWEGWIND